MPTSASAQALALEHYVAPDGCPTQADVQTRLAGVPFTGRNTLDVDIALTEGEYVANLVLHRGDESESRVVLSTTCENVVAAIELLLRIRATRVDLRATSRASDDNQSLMMSHRDEPSSVVVTIDAPAPSLLWHFGVAAYGAVDVGSFSAPASGGLGVLAADWGVAGAYPYVRCVGVAARDDECRYAWGRRQRDVLDGPWCTCRWLSRGLFFGARSRLWPALKSA